MSDRVSTRFFLSAGGRAGLLGAAFLALVAVLSPVLVNDRPLLCRDGRGTHAPALVSYPVLGRLFRYAPASDERVLVPVLLRSSPSAISLPERLEPPTRRHWLGTDSLGRDLLARLIAASPVALAVGLVSSAGAMLIGLFVGCLAGYAGGATDILLSRFIEVVLCFPAIFLVFAFAAFLPASLWTVLAAITFASWPDEARYARAQVLKLKKMEFVLAARASGASPAEILWRHLVPNALAPVLVCATFGVAEAILAESALSFLGVGLPASTPSWGAMLSAAQSASGRAWWLTLFPGLAIFVTVSAYNLIGEAWRDALDPHMRITAGGMFFGARLSGGAPEREAG